MGIALPHRLTFCVYDSGHAQIMIIGFAKFYGNTDIFRPAKGYPVKKCCISDLYLRPIIFDLFIFEKARTTHDLSKNHQRDYFFYFSFHLPRHRQVILSKARKPLKNVLPVILVDKEKIKQARIWSICLAVRQDL